MNTSPRTRRHALIALLGLLALTAALSFSFRGSDALTLTVVEASPGGEEVGLLEPVRLTFDREVPQRTTERAIRISPAVKGTFAWVGQTVEFQPDEPGYARRTTYRVTIAGQSDPALTFRTAGDLKLQRRAPDDGDTEVAIDTPLVVQFNASVPPLTALADTPNRPVVHIDPPVAGEGKWLTSAMYRFRPTEGWQPSTRYTITLEPGLAGLDGEVLEGAVSWSFTTVTPAVADVSPSPETNQAPVAPVLPAPGQPPVPPVRPPGPNLNLLAANGSITIRFNQPVDRAAAERAVSFTPAIAGTFSWTDDRTLVLRPDAPLQRETRYEGTVAAGIPSANGAARGEKAFTWAFTTAGDARVIGTMPTNGATDAPRGNVQISFNTPMDKKSVEERLTIEPKPENGPFFGWEPSEARLHINWHPARPSTDYRVILAPGSVDRFGQAIGEALTLSFRTAPLAPAAGLLTPGRAGVFRAGGSPRVAITGVNTTAVEMILFRLTAEQFAAHANPGYKVPDVSPNPAWTQLRRWRETLPAVAQDRTAVKLVELGNDLSPGYYGVWVPPVGSGTPQFMPFVVTHTHLTLKRSAEELLVWAVDYATGAPVVGMPLRAHGSTNAEVGSGRTDANGLASIAVPAPAPGQNDWFTVTGDRANDLVFGATMWQAGFGGFPYTATLIGSLTSDRPIYRPGETVYYQGVLRRDDDANLSIPPANLQASLVISDPRGRELVRKPITIDEYGAFHGDLLLDAQATAGGYSMRVEQAQVRGSIIFASFTVAEFRRPEFFIEVKPERAEYQNGERITVSSSAELFFGAPVANADIRWRVTAESFTFNPADYPGYSFTDPDDVQRGLPFGARQEGRGKTDEKGAFSFAFPADVSGDTTSQVFTVEVTVTDQDNQEVSASTRVRVHKAARYAGVRPRDYVGSAGRPVTADVVTVDREGKPAANEPLTVKIVERTWNTVQVRDDDGTERYESKPMDRDVETRTVRTGADGRGEVTFTPRTGGFYRFVVSGRDAAGNEYRAAGGVYVTGAGYVPWRISSDDRIELVADKREYKPGDVARVLVPAPFAGATGLVSVERQGILSREVRAFAGNSEVLEVPITRGHVPNVFLSVTLFKPPTDENPLAGFRTGWVELPVSAEEQRLTITLTPDKPKLGPRETVTFAVKTTDANGTPVPAELSLALVDEAVLSLVDEQPRDAFAALYGRKRYGVQTSAASVVSLDRIADRARAQADGEGKGGGGGGGEDSARSDFRFTAHWEPSLRTDANGNGTLSVRMPDTLTTWRLTARGITPDSKAGMAEVKVQTSRPLIVRPVAPRFFTAGDQAELGAIINNLTDAPLDVTVTLAADPASTSVEGGVARSVRVEAGGSQKVTWRTTTTAGGGTARLTWSASGGGYSDTVELGLPVHALATPEVVASSGAVTDRATEVVRGPSLNGARPTEIALELLPSLTSALPETVRYLREWPFESAEVTASRILTAIGVARARGTEPERGEIGRWVQRLYTEQHADGGWGWWRNDPSDPTITAYVVLALTSARDAGITVDEAVITRSAGVLHEHLDRTRDVRTPLNPNTRALYTLALVRADANETARAIALAERRDTLGPEGKALLLLAFQGSSTGRQPLAPSDPRYRALVNDLTAAATVSAAAAHWDDPVSAPGRLTTATRTTALALWALVRADATGPLVDQAVRWLMNERREGRWASTQESALAVMALGAVAELRQESNASYTYRVTLNESTIREGNVQRAADAKPETVVIRDGLTTGENRLTLTREPANAQGRLYYQLSYRYSTPARGIGARDQGVAVAREILSADGSDTPLTKVKAGDLVKVRVTVLASGDMHYLQVDDYLPAGLEAVDTGLRTTSREVLEKQIAEAEPQAKLRGAACRIAFRACFSPFTHAEIRDDRLALFARELPKGAHEYVYFARATTPGTYQIRPSRAAEVYFPDVWGRTDSGVFVVE